MNIAIEARALSAPSGGVKTYTHELLKHLLALHPEDVFEFIYGSYVPVGNFPTAKETVIPLRSEFLLSYWTSFQVARYIQKTKPSLVHYTKAAIPYFKHVPTVVTIYDIIPILFPDTQSPLRRMYWPYVLEHAAKTADHIMTISQRSKRDIIERFGVSEEKITVTPLAVDLQHFAPLRSRQLAGSFAGQAPYILFVGTRDARKNISSLIHAFASIADKIPHNLIVAGRPAKKEDSSKLTVVRCKLQHRVQFLGNISYSELPALYSGADIFIWPSLYEGWGFPPQEAMACGTPVIVSDGGPLPEVVGDAGIIVPLANGSFVEHLAHEMLTLINDDTRKKELSQRGITRVQQFSWNTVAETTWKVYENIANL